mmetsp:Transcript_41517/g.95948  ORF Transcript_41517/g.95948 Transcript_41517/m.95948 type:complete len:248 (-) Transcript_41517:248-991(-)
MAHGRDHQCVRSPDAPSVPPPAGRSDPASTPRIRLVLALPGQAREGQRRRPRRRRALAAPEKLPRRRRRCRRQHCVRRRRHRGTGQQRQLALGARDRQAARAHDRVRRLARTRGGGSAPTRRRVPQRRARGGRLGAGRLAPAAGEHRHAAAAGRAFVRRLRADGAPEPARWRRKRPPPACVPPVPPAQHAPSARLRARAGLCHAGAGSAPVHDRAQPLVAAGIARHCRAPGGEMGPSLQHGRRSSNG